MPTDSPLELVRQFCAAWEHLDLDELCSYFTDDAVYHNIPVAPVVGVSAIRETIAGFTAGIDKVEFRVCNAAANGPIVLTERVDVFHGGGRTIELPVMGTFEVSDGKITAWRDYFDINQFMSQLAS